MNSLTFSDSVANWHYLKKFHFRGRLFVMPLDSGIKDHWEKSISYDYL